MKLLGGWASGRLARTGNLVTLASLSYAASLPLSACRKSAPPPPLVTVLPAPTRPAEVTAEASIPSPQEVWPRLRALAGPIGEVMPRGPELFLCGLAAIPPLSAGLLDLASPVVAVWVGGDAPGIVLGAHLESGAELVAQVSTGTHPTHRVERRAGVAYLSQTSNAAFSFAVASDTLLLGPKGAVERAGEYVARTLRPRAATSGPIALDVVGQGLKSWLVPALKGAWSERRAALVEALGREQNRQGRPADFADPAAGLVAADGLVAEALAVLGSLRDAHGEVTTADAGVTLSLRIVPDAEGAARALFTSLRPGPADQLRQLPPSAALAVFHRRRETGSSSTDTLSALFGARLAAAEAATLRRSIEQLQRGRGAAEAFALMPDLGVVWRGDVTDPTAFSAALQGLLPLVARPPLADALSATVGRPALVRKPREARGADTLERAVIRLAPKTGGAPMTKGFEVTSLVGAQRFVVTFGREGTATLDAALSAEVKGAGLGAAQPWGELLRDSDHVAAVIAADLSRLGLAPPDAAATLGARVRLDDGSLSLRLQASDSAVRALGAKGFGR